MSQTQVTRLMRIAWETVGGILARVVADKLDRGRLDGLVQIGVDEVSYGADHKFLTCVADHVAGSIVWATEGRNAHQLAGILRRAHARAEGVDHRGLDRHVRRV
jgi:transposase